MTTHVNHKLEDRSKLLFVFPQAAGKDPIIRMCPFFENPTIKESQTPRYANYAPIGRSSNLFGYLGADSRKFEVTFNLTLPHMTHSVSSHF